MVYKRQLLCTKHSMIYGHIKLGQVIKDIDVSSAQNTSVTFNCKLSLCAYTGTQHNTQQD